MRVPSGLCSELCVGFVGCCVSSYRFVGWMCRFGLIEVVENVSKADLHPSIVIGFLGGSLDLAWHMRSLLVCLQCGKSAFAVHDRRVKLPCWPPVYFVEWSVLGVVKWVYMFVGESFFCAIIYLFVPG